MSGIARARWALPSLLVGLAACADPLKDAQLVEEPRLLGVRLVTANDQSTLEPGEPAQLEVLLAGTEEALAGRLAYLLCEAANSERGVPFCAAEPLAEATVDLDGAAIGIEVPGDLGPGVRLALLGLACLEGEPRLASDPLDWSCEGGENGLRFSLDARSSAPSAVNRHPDLSGLRMSISGIELEPQAIGTSAACDGATPILAADATHEVLILLGDGAREAEEALQLSHFSNGGRFERQYSFVAAEQAPEARLTWRAPAAGSVLQQYLVVRDGRGGVSWLSFGVCAN